MFPITKIQSDSERFFNKEVYIYSPVISYDSYGIQIVASGIPQTVKAYVGNISATDRELISESLGGIRQRDGVEVREIITVLCSHDIHIKDTDVLHINDKPYNVIYCNSSLMEEVKAYTKAIAVYLARRDEKINFT